MLAGRGYLEVLHQVMLAVATASDMEVAGLIENRSPDGLLPHPSPDSDDPNDPQTSTLTLPTLLQSRTHALTEPASTHAGDTPAEGQRLNSEQPHRAVSVQPHASSGAAAQQAQHDRPAEHALQHVDKQEGNPESDIARQSGTSVQPRNTAGANTQPMRESGSIAELLLEQRDGQKRATPNGPDPAHDSMLSQQPNGPVRSEDQARLGTNSLNVSVHQPEASAGNSAAVGAQAGLVSDQDMPQPAEDETGPRGALRAQDIAQPAEDEAGSSGVLPDQDMAQHATEAGPSRALPDQAMGQPAEEEAGPSSSGLHAHIATVVPQQRKRKFDSGPNPLVSCEFCAVALYVAGQHQLSHHLRAVLHGVTRLCAATRFW